MQTFKKFSNITGLTVLLASFIVFFLSAERTGSLWDCGEFVLGAYKLQVVHPPGAGLFVIIGRMFTWIAQIFSNDPSDIAFSVNIMSSLCSALSAMFLSWSMMILGRLALVGRMNEPDQSQNFALAGAGLIAGLSSAFITSVWFSAVEGEVYAMSTFFTALTVWSAIKWYALPNETQSDRWLILSIFAAGLSVGVHLLSLLAFPAIAMLYYYKKFDNKSIIGLLTSIIAGGVAMTFIQKTVIVGIPTMWQSFELFMVNSLGMPFHSGIVPTFLLIAGILYFVLRVAHKRGSQLLQTLAVAASLIIIAYSTIGVVVIRANADTPVNMNTPTDAMRLIPYLNREQYGERPLIKGPHYLAQPVNVESTDRWGRVGNKYEIVDQKSEYVWKPSDKIFFPRIGHQDKVAEHQQYKEYLTGKGGGKPDQSYNIKYFINHQLKYMYFRYFMWNFVGRQNSDQGTGPWDHKNGNWASGFSATDYSSENAPVSMLSNTSHNTYYFLPFLLGLLGMMFHFTKSKKDFLAVLMLFVVTGIGIIMYSNQPPIEPRERDYVLVGSFVTFCIWIGFGVLALYSFFSWKLNLKGISGGAGATLLGLAVPAILLFQNFDDHNRSHHFASRDYAANFLNSLEKNAVLFTYGDNDTYPLWYVQEVEGIRTDVRVVNLSLIQVDWYIDKLRNKVNQSEPIKMTISQKGYAGKNLNQIFFTETPSPNRVNLITMLKNAERDAPGAGGYPSIPYNKFYIPFDQSKAKPGLFDFKDLTVSDSIEVNLASDARYLTKDDVAILDLVASNIHDRPVYFSVTCKNEKLQGMNDYMQLEGLGLRVIPVKTMSDRSFSIYGSGRVAAELVKNHVMKDWKYGNFDKIQTHVDKSYLAAVQSMKLVMLRTAYNYVEKGDSTNAALMANKYFEAFPHMNFNYDAGIVPFINVLVNAKDYTNAKKHIKILAEETQQQGNFLLSLKRNDRMSYINDVNQFSQAAKDLKGLTTKIGDKAFEDEINKIVGDLDMKLNSLYQEMTAGEIGPQMTPQ